MADSNDPLESQSSLGDTISTNRALKIPEAASISDMPAGFRATEPKILQRVLRRIPGTQRAEGIAALEECAAKGPQLALDLGPDVPSVAQAEALVKRLKRLRSAKTKLLASLACYEELEDIAHHDMVLLLEAVRNEYDYFAKKKPTLASDYEHLVGFFDERSEAIRRGINEAQKNEEKEKNED